jgi:hypothetical protein
MGAVSCRILKDGVEICSKNVQNFEHCKTVTKFTVVFHLGDDDR